MRHVFDWRLSRGLFHGRGRRVGRKGVLAAAISALALISAFAIPLANAAGTATNKPGNFRVTGTTSSSVSLSWSGVSGATGYTVAWGTTSGAQTFKKVVTGTSATISPLNAGRAYYFEVWSNPSPQGGPHAGPIKGVPTAVASSALVTAAPTGFTATATTNYGIALKWNKVANAKFYTVAWGTTSGSQANQKSTTSTSLTLSPLNGHTKYYFEVWGDPIKVGGPHASTSATTSNDPTVGANGPLVTVAPGNFQVTGTTDTSVSLAWAPAANATSYTVAYGTSVANPQQYRYTTPNTTATITSNIQAGTTYYFEVWGNPTNPGGPHAGPIPAVPGTTTGQPPDTTPPDTTPPDTTPPGTTPPDTTDPFLPPPPDTTPPDTTPPDTTPDTTPPDTTPPDTTPGSSGGTDLLAQICASPAPTGAVLLVGADSGNLSNDLAQCQANGWTLLS